MKRLKLLALLIFPALLTIFIIKQLSVTKVVAWFNDSWAYRKSIAVTNNTTAESNVYILVTLDTSDTTKFQTDAGDLRFTKKDGELLPYYISSGVGTTSTSIQVKFDTFPAGAQTIYYYYGNPSASSGQVPSGFLTQATNYTIGSLGTEEQSKAPVAYWSLDEGTGSTAYDSSSNKNNGSLGTGSSAPSWQTEDMCISGKCLKFDGSNDYVSAGSTGISGATQLTVSAWIKAIDFARDYPHIINTENNNIALHGLGPTYGANQGKIGFYLDDTPTGNITTSTILSNNTWYHIATTYDGSSIRLYLNGKLEGSNTNYNVGALGSFNTIHIGTFTTNASSNLWKGLIDEVKIYPYARSAAEIKADYNARGTQKGVGANVGARRDAPGQPSSLSNGLVGYWNFDVGVGGSAPDLSGNANTATFGTGSSAPGWATGNYGIGASFDGNDYCNIGDKSQYKIASKTISFWAKPAIAFSSTTPVVSTGTTGNWYVGFSSSGRMMTSYLNTILTQKLGYSANNVVETGVWKHYTYVFNVNGDKVEVSFYVNGTFLETDSFTGGHSATYGTNTVLGAFSTSQSFYNGSLDEVRIYNRALSPSEVSDLYNWAPGPKVHLKLDEGSGTSATDTSGNSNTGTVNGGSWTNGKYGKGIKLDGSDDNVSVSDFSY